MYLFDNGELIDFAEIWHIRLRRLLFRGSRVVRGARKVGKVGKGSAQIGVSEPNHTLRKNQGDAAETMLETLMPCKVIVTQVEPHKVEADASHMGIQWE